MKTSAKINIVKNSLKNRLFKFPSKVSSTKTPLNQFAKLNKQTKNRVGRRTILTSFFVVNSCSLNETIKPNIIWLVLEDQSQYFFPFYGDNTIELENINKLLDNGIVYEGMNSPYPVCAPSRSAIITGMYPNSIGTGNQRAYSYYRSEREEHEKQLGFPFYSSKFAEQIKPFTQILRENGYYTSNNSKEDYNFKLTKEAWDDSSINASWENRSENEPFFSVFNFGISTL